jgi:hypothetical protein
VFHVDCVVNEHRAYLDRHPRIRSAVLSGAHVDLSGADLSGAGLSQASLTLVELGRANLSRCDLRRSTWTSCIADDAVLAGADLTGGAFVACRFDGADFTGASLRADTQHSTFARARFENAEMFAWSREVVVEILARAVDDLEAVKMVGAVALRQEWCYDTWRSILAGVPQHRDLALRILGPYPDSGFAVAMREGAVRSAAPAR